MMEVMEMPVARCSNCGKAFKINEGIMEAGKAFCSEECKKGSITPQSNDVQQQDE